MIREMDISDYPQVIELWSETEVMLLRDADSRENIGKYL
ncbi:acetyltransferase, partial [Vibrio parahaemolyticus]